MSDAYLKELEEGLRDWDAAPRTIPDHKGVVGIAVADGLLRRLLQSASTQLELVSRVLTADALEGDDLGSCEMIVADEPIALRIGAMFREQEERGMGCTRR